MEKQTRLQRQLQQALDERAAREKTLQNEGVALQEWGGDPVWRSLNARCSRIRARIRAAEATAALNKSLQAAETEKPAGPAKGKKKGKG